MSRARFVNLKASKHHHHDPSIRPAKEKYLESMIPGKNVY